MVNLLFISEYYCKMTLPHIQRFKSYVGHCLIIIRGNAVIQNIIANAT